MPQPLAPFSCQIHPHHPVIFGIALPTYHALALQRLADSGQARRVQVESLAYRALGDAVLFAEHRQYEPLARIYASLALDDRHHPLERQTQRSKHRRHRGVEFLRRLHQTCSLRLLRQQPSSWLVGEPSIRRYLSSSMIAITNFVEERNPV